MLKVDNSITRTMEMKQQEYYKGCAVKSQPIHVNFTGFPKMVCLCQLLVSHQVLTRADSVYLLRSDETELTWGI